MKKFLSILLALTVLCAFAAFALGSSDDSSASVSSGDGTTNSTTTQNKNVTVNKGDVLTTSNLEITYNECGEYKGYSQYFAPESGNKIIYIEITAKCISDSDAYITMYDFECYADDVSAEQYFGADDDISATLSSGRSATGRVYFEVPKDAENIEIEYETDFWDDQKAIFVVK